MNSIKVTIFIIVTFFIFLIVTKNGLRAESKSDIQYLVENPATLFQTV